MKSACAWFLAKMIVLPEAVAAGHGDAARHQVGEDLVDGVAIEQPRVDRSSLDLVRNVAVVVPVQRVPVGLLVFGQVIVSDAPALELGRH